MRSCVQCGALYAATQEFTGYARRFCSTRCAGDHARAKARESYPPEEEIRRLYETEGLSDKELGARFGRSHQWSLKVRRAYGIAGRRGPTPKHQAKPRVQSNGYVRVGDEWEHRKVIEAAIGRPLVKGESVHHIDGDPTNNDPANLVLYPSQSEHLWDERGRHAKNPRRSTARVARRDWTEPRQKVEAEGRCRVCGRSDIKIDAAHIVSRAQVSPGAGEHVDNIVPLCAERCHPAFDAGRLDLLPFLTLGEQGYAVRVHPGGMLGALHRITGERWQPQEEAA